MDSDNNDDVFIAKMWHLFGCLQSMPKRGRKASKDASRQIESSALVCDKYFTVVSNSSSD